MPPPLRTPIERKVELVRERVGEAYRLLKACALCPRHCAVNRIEGEFGVCKVGEEVVISTAALHPGEEPPLSGWRGSGTIFFSSCNLKCVFCQNYPLSQLGEGEPVTIEDLAAKMLLLEQRGAHNINLVTPTHFAPQIMKALGLACKRGLTVPVVYNCGGYESLDMLRLWDGIIDVYMPDMKYGRSDSAKKFSAAPDYPEANQRAVREMHRQVGDLVLDANGLAVRGLLIRHLVLPNDLSGTEEVLRFLATEISRHTAVSLMSQYFPDYRAREFPELSRRITRDEYKAAKALMEKYGLDRGWHQNVPIDESVHNVRRYLDESL